MFETGKEEKLYVKREYKDTVFRMLFGKKKNLLELYNGLNGTDYQNEEELEIYTLENAVYMGMKNDVSSYYKVVVFIVPLQGLYAILLEILWIGSCFLPLDGLRKATTTVSLYSC